METLLPHGSSQMRTVNSAAAIEEGLLQGMWDYPKSTVGPGHWNLSIIAFDIPFFVLLFLGGFLLMTTGTSRLKKNLKVDFTDPQAVTSLMNFCSNGGPQGETADLSSIADSPPPAPPARRVATNPERKQGVATNQQQQQQGEARRPLLRHGVAAQVESESKVFLLLSRTRIRPHSGFDRGKRPRGRLKLGKSRSASYITGQTGTAAGCTADFGGRSSPVWQFWGSARPQKSKNVALLVLESKRKSESGPSYHRFIVSTFKSIVSGTFNSIPSGHPAPPYHRCQKCPGLSEVAAAGCCCWPKKTTRMRTSKRVPVDAFSHFTSVMCDVGIRMSSSSSASSVSSSASSSSSSSCSSSSYSAAKPRAISANVTSSSDSASSSSTAATCTCSSSSASTASSLSASSSTSSSPSSTTFYTCFSSSFWCCCSSSSVAVASSTSSFRLSGSSFRDIVDGGPRPFTFSFRSSSSVHHVIRELTRRVEARCGRRTARER